MIALAINNDTSQNKITGRVLVTLDSANRNVSSLLKKNNGIYTKKRYNEIKKNLSKIADDLRNRIESDIDIDSFLQNELNELNEIYTTLGSKEYLNIPTLEQVKVASTFIPYTDTRTFDSFLKNINEQFFDIWDSALRTGYMIGLTTDEVVRNVIGSVAKNAQVARSGTIDTLKKSLIANTKTALQSFAIETQCKFYQSNEDLFDGYKWLGTLDRRTCLVCASLDGKIFKKLSDITSKPPMHLNCRCVLVANFNDNIDDTRASENGQVDSKITYEDWLKEQSEEVQKNVLGMFKYREFKRGMPLKSFISTNGYIIPDKLMMFSDKSIDILNRQPKVNKEVLKRVIKGLEATGHEVAMNKETDRYLETFGKEAVTYSNGTVLYHSKLSTSGMYEEIIHLSQLRLYGYNYCSENYDLLEIEAKKKLLKNAKSYGISDYEKKIIRETLKYHEDKLNKKTE